MSLRQRVARITCWLLDKKFGAGSANDWLWNCTCFPYDCPSWKQIWQGVRLVDGSLSWKRLDEQVWQELKACL